jgi:hypothetical protein
MVTLILLIHLLLQILLHLLPLLRAVLVAEVEVENKEEDLVRVEGGEKEINIFRNYFFIYQNFRIMQISFVELKFKFIKIKKF